MALGDNEAARFSCLVSGPLRTSTHDPLMSQNDPMQTLRGRQSERQGFLGAGRILLDVMTDVAGIFGVTKDWENGQMADITKGRFDFHRGGGKHEPVPVAAYVQIYVKSSVLSRAPDLAISAHLTTEEGGIRTHGTLTRTTVFEF